MEIENQSLKNKIRTKVYIDAANIILSAKNLNLSFDILKYLKHVKDIYRDAEIFYFTGKFSNQEKVFKEIEVMNIKIIYKYLYNQNNKLKANCDVEISHKITRDIVDDYHFYKDDNKMLFENEKPPTRT